MSDSHGPGCSCCAGTQDRTPLPLFNRPGLSSINYRVGAYPEFRASMLAGLTREGREALAALRTRDAADFSIGLMEAWAVAADVLTFYTERTANEHYLGTATERRSIAELAALLGYRLKPGVAASTWLAFSLETAAGSPAGSTIGTGAKVQTLPGPGEVPQTFETVEPLDALGAWNRPLLAMREARTPRDGDTSVLLAGTAPGVRRGETLLFVADDWSATDAADRWCRVRVTAVASDAARGTTTVTFSPALSDLALQDGVPVRVYAMRGQAALFGFNAPDPRLFDADVKSGLGSAIQNNEWVFDEITGGEVFLDGLYEGVEPGSWAVLESQGPLVIDGGGVIVSRAIVASVRHVELAPVGSVRETAKSGYGISGRVTMLDVGRSNSALEPFGGDGTRSTIVQFRSEALTLADVPMAQPLYGSDVPLAEPIVANAVARRVLLRGKRPRATSALDGWPAGDPALVIGIEDDAPGLDGQTRWTVRDAEGEEWVIAGAPDAVTYLPALPEDGVIGETAIVEAAEGETAPVAVLRLAAPLANVYDRQGDAPIEIFGNVAPATHGETVAGEVLGSGDGAKPFQHFTLRKPPLTYVASEAGSESTLELRVNGLLWQEAETLFAHAPRDRVYTTAIGEDSATTITFGDGEQGARLPTGVDNVVARYRAGLGLAGMARADQITLALTRPLGLKSVTNPLAASGGQDSQSADDARVNAPRSVLTMQRVVSLQDYADYARDFPGVGKATATWTWDGRQRGVLVTIAAADGNPLPEGSELLANLKSALLAAGSVRVALELRDFHAGRFAMLAVLRVNTDYEPGAVRSAVEAALLDRYSFGRRDFGEDVSLSEVAEAIHAVSGVEAVRIDRLHRADEAASLASVIPARVPIPGGPPSAQGAELLTLAPGDLTLEVGW